MGGCRHPLYAMVFSEIGGTCGRCGKLVHPPVSDMLAHEHQWERGPHLNRFGIDGRDLACGVCGVLAPRPDPARIPAPVPDYDSPLCRWGHPLNAANARVTRRGAGTRTICRACEREREAQRRVLGRGRKIPNRPRYAAQRAARLTVQSAIRSGRLTRESCRECGAVLVDAHHYLGYAPEHRLDVVWLCPPHHAEAHRKMRENAA
jgi:hypothetical protein